MHTYNNVDHLVVLGNQQVLFKIHTGRNNLKSGTLTIESTGNQIKYALESARVLSEGSVHFCLCVMALTLTESRKAAGDVSCMKSKIEIKDIPAGYELLLSVPYAGSPRNDELEVGTGIGSGCIMGN